MSELRVCLKPGCPELVERGYCDEHRPKRRRAPDKRPSARRRGYGTRWERTRAAFLAKNPKCVACGARATVADHIENRGPLAADGHDFAALQALCASCHGDKTARFDGGFGRPRLER